MPTEALIRLSERLASDEIERLAALLTKKQRLTALAPQEREGP